jgi:hypothetical protein
MCLLYRRNDVIFWPVFLAALYIGSTPEFQLFAPQLEIIFGHMVNWDQYFYHPLTIAVLPKYESLKEKSLRGSHISLSSSPRWAIINHLPKPWGRMRRNTIYSSSFVHEVMIPCLDTFGQCDQLKMRESDHGSPVRGTDWLTNHLLMIKWP